MFQCMPISVMKGDNDNSLSWPFTGTVTFKLLNQLEDKNYNHKNTILFPADYEGSQRVVNGERGRGYGSHKFISHADLDYNVSKNTHGSIPQERHSSIQDCIYTSTRLQAVVALRICK